MKEEPDIYAKVLKKFDQEENNFLVWITGIPPKGLQRLNEVRECLGSISNSCNP